MSHKNMPRHSANRLLCAAPVLADYGENFDNSIDLLVTGRTCGDVEDHDGWGGEVGLGLGMKGGASGFRLQCVFCGAIAILSDR